MTLITCLITAIFLSLNVSQAQQSEEAPFVILEKAIKDERGGFAGNKDHLSTVFNAERKRLGDRFESQLMRWLGNDVERHYWSSFFLESESYLHGSKPLPYLSLLVKQQGLVLVQGKEDQKSRGYTVGLNITAAILSHQLGFPALASNYKTQAETLLVRDPDLSVFVPAVTEEEHRQYDAIESSVRSKLTTVVVSDTNPAPKAKVSGGVLNGKALNLVKPTYPAAGRASGASGKVEVQIVFDGTGKVIWARAISGHPDLRQAAEDAAWRTTFTPLKLSGEPVTVRGVLVYNFVL
ncbi:MAG: periplasmic protein TonB [Acidobacteriota bacterium]